MKDVWERLLPALVAATVLTACLCTGHAEAQEQAGWRDEFEAVCVKTDIALTLSSEELVDLVSRCDRLAERIGAEPEIVRRVYLKRLQSCRALFAYVLESRNAAPAGASSPPAAPPEGRTTP